MLPIGDDNGNCQIPSGHPDRFTNATCPLRGTTKKPNAQDMITQNPIIGRARKKLGGVYCRTLYGKNIIQACPPPKAGSLAPSQIESGRIFGYISRLSNQVSPSLLNNLFYTAPIGRSRRAEWMQQLSQGKEKQDNGWDFNPSLITRLGGNEAVTAEPMILTPTQNQLRFSVAEFSSIGRADLTKTPCLILLCKETQQCISLLSWTSIEDEEIVLQNLSPTFLGHECYLYCLWQYNQGTQQNPIWVYGSYQKIG